MLLLVPNANYIMDGLMTCLQMIEAAPFAVDNSCQRTNKIHLRIPSLSHCFE